MKLLILTPNYPRKNAVMNGVFIHQQVKALQQLGAECHVLLFHNWYPKFQLHRLHPNWEHGYVVHKELFNEFEGIKVHHIPIVWRMPDRIFRNDYYKRAADALVTYIRKTKELQNADWLYTHFLTDCGYIGSLVKDRLGIKLAAIARGDDVHAWPQKDPALVLNLEQVFDKADLLLANSGRLAKDAQKWMRPGKIRDVETVYNGVDYKKFRPVESESRKRELQLRFKLPPSYKYLICVATPVKLKGWMELLNAIKQLSATFEGWKLVMVSNNRSNSDAIDLVAAGNELGISDKLVFMGQVKPGDLSDLYRACDAFVLPSYNEGMANALLEAMASGLVCIATDVGGHAEVIDNGNNGLLVRPENVPELKLAISQICTDIEFSKRLGINARHRMELFGSYTDNARKLFSLLENN